MQVNAEFVRRLYDAGQDSFGDVDITLADVVDAGDQVLATVLGYKGGIVDYHFAVWTFVDGRVTRMQIFDDQEEARRAIGPSVGSADSY